MARHYSHDKRQTREDRRHESKGMKRYEEHRRHASDHPERRHERSRADSEMRREHERMRHHPHKHEMSSPHTSSHHHRHDFGSDHRDEYEPGRKYYGPGYGKPSNLPQDVEHHYYPAGHYGLGGEYPDTLKEIDENAMYNHHITTEYPSDSMY